MVFENLVEIYKKLCPLSFSLKYFMKIILSIMVVKAWFASLILNQASKGIDSFKQYLVSSLFCSFGFKPTTIEIWLEL